MVFCETPLLSDTTDHGLVLHIINWDIWFIVAILGVILWGDYKIWLEIKKKHVEESSDDAKKLKAISDKTIEKLVENVDKLAETVEKIDDSNTKLNKDYESIKESWTKIESDYRHIRKSLETFNDNTPKIQDGLLDLMNELKAEVKKVEEIKMSQGK